MEKSGFMQVLPIEAVALNFPLWKYWSGKNKCFKTYLALFSSIPLQFPSANTFLSDPNLLFHFWL
jgi:hypothetical protein